MPTTRRKLCQSLTPELRSISVEQTDSLLLKIVRANFNAQYASKTASLAEFRDAISAHGSSTDTVLVDDFRRRVPLTDYDSYKPFMAVFDKHPCKETELENLFAPGLPLFLAMSSATSGKQPKLFPKYRFSIPNVFDPREQAALIVFCGFREVKEVEREPGQIVQTIPVSTVTGGLIRVMLGWTNFDEDNSRMSLAIPGFAAPLAATMIKHYKSFLLVHALFTLVCRDLGRISTTFSTLFYELVQHIDEEWDTLLSSIKNGTVPDLPGVGEVRSHLQAHLYANPGRAAELREIGPPLSCEGWAARVWPKLTVIIMMCSGPFATVIPKIKLILGPSVAIRTHDYGSSESIIGAPHQPDDLDIFVLRSRNIVEFLDVTIEESHGKLSQAWELEVGKLYEVVLTTSDGLWRYRLGDVVNVLGFDTTTGSPVFAFSGRRNSAIRFPATLVSDTDLTSAVQAVSPDVLQISEFTAVLEDRQITPTVGFFVELAGTLGPNAHLAPSRLAEGLAGANAPFQGLLESGKARHPTVRIVKSGTFAEYRQWRAEKMAIGPGQVKVPVILPDATSLEWILERVIGEI